MPNNLEFITPLNGNFTVSGAVSGQTSPHVKTFTVDTSNLFSFVPDRRPIYQAGLATQPTPYNAVTNDSATFGVNQQAYRKTGATGSNTSEATNGRLKWLNDKVSHTCDGTTYTSNFERFHLTNIGGHTSLNKGNQQPHFTSGAYQVLNMPAARYYIKKDGSVANSSALPTPVYGDRNKWYRAENNDHYHILVWTGSSSTGSGVWEDMGVPTNPTASRPYYLMTSPFTDDGLTSGTLGDSKDAWTQALAAFRTAAAPASLEITSYQGYRPVFNNSTGYTPLNHQTAQLISLSKQSSNSVEPSWQGQDNSDPAYCPEPGWDGSVSSVWDNRIASYFTPEIAGITSLGFDGIGLDTGTRVWDNAGGLANGDYSSQNPDGTAGNAGIVNYFNSQGLKPTFEAVGLDTWTNSALTPPDPIPETGTSRYESSAYWAYFGSWWSWDDGVSGMGLNGSGGTIHFNGPNDGNQTVGSASNGGSKFDLAGTEVHCIFQWIGGASGSAANKDTKTVGWILENHGMVALKQCLYDFHKAGLIASAAGSAEDFTAATGTTNAGTVFAAADFYNFILDLAAGNITVRPTAVAPSAKDYTDYMAADAGADHAVIPFNTSITSNVTLVGDGSSTWANYTTSVGVTYPLDTVSGRTVTAPATNKRCLIGPNSAQSNPYQYVAVGYREASGQYQGVVSAGWIVLEREQTIGSVNPAYQAYFPVEGTDGINGVTPYENGALPSYNTSNGTGSLDMVIFFFDGYQAGDVQTWTVWDGATTPDTYADWDSFASTGRFRVDMNSATNVEVLTAETTYGNPSGGEIGSSATADFLIYTTDAPAFAVWSVVNSTWVVSTRNPAADAGRLAYGDGSNQFVVNDFYYIVPLSIATPPVNPSTWRAYDGPAIRDYDEYMAANAGVGYWEVPAGTGSTSSISGPTGGDPSTTWVQVLANLASRSGTTQSGNVITNAAGNGLSGNFNSFGNPYNYAAVSFGNSNGGHGQATNAGWVILERELVAGAARNGYQSFIPIESTTEINGSTSPAGGMPSWAPTGYDDSMVFFFDGYQAGDVDTWTVWDDATNPTTYEDWDTYHSGFVEYNPQFNNNPVGSNHVLQGDITWRNSVSSYLSNTTIHQKYFASADGGQWYPPAIAQWYPNANGGVGEWRVGEYVSHNSHATSTTVVYDIASSPNQEVYTIYLDTVPVTLPSTWRAYDGPVPADFSSPKFYPVATVGIAGNLAGFSSNQYNGTQLFDNLGMVQINTTIATDAVVFFFHTVLARDEFKAFTDFTFGGTSFNPSADADWVELNAGSKGFGLKYTDSAVCAAWTASMTSRSNTGNVTGSYTGTSTFATPAQTMTWTLGGTPGAPWTNSGSTVSAVTGTEFLRPETSEYVSGPRLLNGAEANNFGAFSYAFQNYPSGTHLSSKAQCIWYWQSLDVRTSNSRLGTPSGAWTIQRAPIFTEPQANYNNISEGYGQGNIVAGPDFNGWEGGDDVDFEIRDSSYTSNRIISFTFNGTDGYQPNQVTLQGQVWAGRNTTAAVAVNSTTAQNFSYYMGDDGKRDGVLQWLSATSNGLEIYDRDADVAYACTFALQSSSRIRVTMTTGSWVSGHRYELRYV